MAGVGLVQRIELEVGDELAQEARRLGRLAVVEVHLGAADPGAGVVRVRLAPAPVRLERVLGPVVGEGVLGLELQHRRVVVRRVLSVLERAPGLVEVALFEGVPAFVQVALRLGIQGGLFIHGLHYTRRRRELVPFREGIVNYLRELDGSMGHPSKGA